MRLVYFKNSVYSNSRKKVSDQQDSEKIIDFVDQLRRFDPKQDNTTAQAFSEQNLSQKSQGLH
jgi:Asp-tRNA(Asn)/Glu-tRNA(Gln) amidotransferase C subunit